MKIRFYQMLTVVSLCVAAAALAVAVWTSVRAQEENSEAALAIPTTINYQGYLREPDGSLTNGSYKITAKIYSAATGGSSLYTTSLPEVTVRDGLFNIVLGDDPLMPATVFTSSPLYIGISLDSDPELIPRQRLHAVPWAFQASTLVNNAQAQTVKGLTSNGKVTVNGKTVMNGDATVSGNASVGGDITASGGITVTGDTVLSGDVYVLGDVTAAGGGTTIHPMDGLWGDWYPWAYCPQYTYVCGASARFEGYQGDSDDTAMNGIMLKCCSLGQDPTAVP
jgi:hypothetical protein